MKITIKGSSSFKNMDMACFDCGYAEERSFDVRGLQTEEEIAQACIVACPNCGKDMEKVWLKAPSQKMGNDRDDHNIAKMQQSFKERFVKKEINDVRHKYGVLFDDALRSTAAQRIKKGEEQ